MIVVGVDGSDGSRRALQWALREAQLRRCPVQVVTAWTEQRSMADEGQRHVVDGAQRELRTSGEISRELVHGAAVDVLIQASKQAALLVVGSHRVTSLRHAGRPSVSEGCARLAECPCVVVPAPIPSNGRKDHTALQVSSMR